MKLWLASSDCDLIARQLSSGIFAGVVTNPAVVAEAKRDRVELFRDLVKLAPVVWYQLLAGTEKEMLADAEHMLAIDPVRMRIKVPATRTGLGVIRRLSDQNLHIMATCVPTRSWLVLALAAGARVIAPYSSMLQKRGIAAKAEEVVLMQELIDRQGSPAEILTGLYDPTDLPYYAAHGIRSGFIWAKDVDAFLTQPLAEEAAAGFGGY